jgi:hypothetical protein
MCVPLGSALFVTRITSDSHRRDLCSQPRGRAKSRVRALGKLGSALTFSEMFNSIRRTFLAGRESLLIGASASNVPPTTLASAACHL